MAHPQPHNQTLNAHGGVVPTLPPSACHCTTSGDACQRYEFQPSQTVRGTKLSSKTQPSLWEQEAPVTSSQAKHTLISIIPFLALLTPLK